MGEGECAHDAVHKVLDVDLDVHEDVEAGDGCDIDRDEAGVAIVDQEVSLQCPRAEVVHAAGPICHVPQDEHMLRISKAAHTEDPSHLPHSALFSFSDPRSYPGLFW